tara:strand:+ start:2077 stop:2610 length:534 start_codon:yes stop_codon:yes gene_type:complete
MTEEELKKVLNPSWEKDTEEEIEEFLKPKEEKPKKKTRKKKAESPKYDESLYQGDEFKTPLNKYKKSAAKFFDTTIEHLTTVANILNGRKIDGFITNELIGRLGFFNMDRVNRQKVAEMKNLRDGSNGASTISVDMATDKLKEMVHESDPLKAYTNYVEGYQNIVKKEINDEAGTGE